MGQFNYLKLLCVILYVAFAGISCWATAESLNLTWPSIPLVVCYVVAIGFYIVASIGATMVANAFNKDKFFSNRGWMLCGGLVILMFFWIITSLPTNTHTFLYRNVIGNIINDEQTTTNGYLKQIQTGQSVQNKITQQQAQIENDVMAKLGALKAEIENMANPGDGPEAQKIRDEISTLLVIPPVGKLSGQVVTAKERHDRYQAYEKIFMDHLTTKKQNIATTLNAQFAIRKQYVTPAKLAEKNIDAWVDAWQAGGVNANNSEDVRNDFNDRRLMNAYTLVKTCKNYVNFLSPEDQERYTNSETKLSQILSVYDLWIEFINGTYSGSTLFFIFCIMVSFLVDVSAFVFFYLIQK